MKHYEPLKLALFVVDWRKRRKKSMSPTDMPGEREEIIASINACKKPNKTLAN
jgi:hypothetical protein